MNLAGLLMLAQPVTIPEHPPVVTAAAVAYIPGHGDALVDADDLAPASCDSGTGYWMVVSVRHARVLLEANPSLVCEPGVERYGPVA